MVRLCAHGTLCAHAVPAHKGLVAASCEQVMKLESSGEHACALRDKMGAKADSRQIKEKAASQLGCLE
jgi:hypothetical protein